MELKEILPIHITSYVKNGAKVLDRLGFLIGLITDIRKHGVDVENSKEIIFNTLKIKLCNETVDRVYEMCLLRDLEKSIKLTLNVDVEKQEIEQTTEDPVENDGTFEPIGISESDMESIRNKEVYEDKAFLKAIGYKE